MPKTKISLIGPNSPFLITQKVHPPLGVLYLASSLRKHNVEIIDLAGLNHAEREKAIRSINSEFVGVSATTPQFGDALKIRSMLPDGTTSVIGGVHVTHQPLDGLTAGYDFVVVGEGEKALSKIIENKVLGNVVYETEIPNIDKISFPDRSAIDIHSYKYYIDGEPATTIITSRGCPFHCAFCSKIWQTVRFHSADYVCKELKEIKEKYGFNAVLFFDDVFTLKPKRLKDICVFLKRERMLWRCFVKSDTVNEKMLKMMAQSGCKEIGMGIESGSEKLLETIYKGNTVDQGKRVIKWAHNAGMRVKGFFIVGMPGESHDTIEETKQFISDYPCDDYDFSLLSVLPGSKIWANPKRYDVVFEKSYNHSWYKGTPGMYKATVSTSHLSAEELTDIRDTLEREVKPKEKLK